MNPTTISNVGGPPLSFAIAPLTSPVDFPFNFLHIEMVKHFKDRDREIAAKKEEWINRCKESDFAEILNKNNSLVSNQIFLQGNAETRLESIGYQVGFILVEKIARDIPRLTNELETMKFICKEFWTSAFGKSVDNLRTNHQGIYIMQDNKFYTLASFSEGTQYINESAIFLAFPSGVIRGALANLSIQAIVTPQIEKLPIVKFNIQLNK